MRAFSSRRLGSIFTRSRVPGVRRNWAELFVVFFQETRSMQRSRRRVASAIRVRGFTLIELLIVVAIIMLLLSIIGPSLAAAKRRTLSLVCQTNLRILAEAINQYVQVNNGWYPDVDPYPIAPGISPDITTHSSCLPHRIFQVKLLWDDPNRVYRAWYCPVKGAYPEGVGLRGMGHGTYVYNSRDLSFHYVNGRRQGRHQSKRMKTSEVGLLRDLVALDRTAAAGPNTAQTEAWFGVPHDRGQNIVFLDQHAEYSTDRRYMYWPTGGDPEFPKWFTGNYPPLPDF